MDLTTNPIELTIQFITFSDLIRLSLTNKHFKKQIHDKILFSSPIDIPDAIEGYALLRTFKNIQLNAITSLAWVYTSEIHLYPDLKLLTFEIITCNIPDDILSKMTTLTSLNMGYSPQNTNNGISTLTNLISLKIPGISKIDDTGVLPLTNLQHLDLYSSTISNKALPHFPKLTYLKINSCPNINGHGIRNLTNLTELNIYPNSYKFLFLDDDLSPLTNLTSLSIHYCNKVTHKGIHPLSKLQQLTISFDTYHINESLNYIPPLSSLKELTLDGFSTRDYIWNSIRKLSTLTSLIMTGCLDPNIIPTLTQLKKLELHFYSSNAHLEKINYLTNLIDFQCHGPLRIEHISNLTNLESFTLNSMSEIYIRELGHFSNLTFLDIEAFPSNRYWLGELCVLPKLKSLNVDKIIINSGLTKFLNKNFSPALILNGMRVSYYFEDLYYIEGRRIMQKR